MVKDGPVKVIGGMLVTRPLGRLMLGRLMLGVAMLLGRELGRTTVRKLALDGTTVGTERLVGTRVETKALGMMLTGTTRAEAVAMPGFVANMDCKTLTTAGKAGKGEKSVV